VLVDADDELPCVLGPRLNRLSVDAKHDVCCVIANLEYETWFVAAAESLQEYLHVSPGEVPAAPEQAGFRKGWIQHHYRGTKYIEPIDQPRMTTAMDLKLCRLRSPSFDKLCRELQRRLPDQ
jgi:hypothetical protein